MKIITIGREFGSGGRELGKRLADALNVNYYDKEIISLIAKNSELDYNYVESVLNKQAPTGFYFSFSNTLQNATSFTSSVAFKVLVEQRKVIEELAKTDCVIVGRTADVILEKHNPFKIFVYADMESKINRCKSREKEHENLTTKKLIKEIKAIDNGRRRLHAMLGSTPWGDKSGYDLMINTTGVEIKKIIPSLAEYIKKYYE